MDLYGATKLTHNACGCRVERSTDQVMKPVNTDALSTWVGHIPADVMSDMAEIAPMLARLGYDPHANPPDYTRSQPMESLYNYSQVGPGAEMTRGQEGSDFWEEMPPIRPHPKHFCQLSGAALISWICVVAKPQGRFVCS